MIVSEVEIINVIVDIYLSFVVVMNAQPPMWYSWCFCYLQGMLVNCSLNNSCLSFKINNPGCPTFWSTCVSHCRPDLVTGAFTSERLQSWALSSYSTWPLNSLKVFTHLYVYTCTGMAECLTALCHKDYSGALLFCSCP